MRIRINLRAIIAATIFVIVIGACKEDAETLQRKTDDGVKIENLQTRLRIVESIFDDENPEDIWRSNPKGIMMNYLPVQQSKGNAYFGYTDADGSVLLCEVINYSDFAKSWKGEFVHTTPLGTITEINILMNATIQLYTNDNGEKYGTLELMLLEQSGIESDEPTLQSGVYLDTYPHSGCTIVDFIDKETVKITSVEVPDDQFTYKYKICEHAIILTDPNGVVPEQKLFFRIINNSKFELDYLYSTTAEKSGSVIMTFEREKD